MQLCTSYMYIPYMTWFIRITAVTALHMCHNSFIWNCAPHICTYLISYDVFKCTRTHLTRLVHMCHDSRGVPYVYIQMHTPYMYIPYIIWRIYMHQDSFDTTRSHVPWLAGCPIDIHSTAYPKYVHTLRDMTHSHVSWLLYICAMTHPYVPKLKNRTNRRTITNIGICGMLHKTCTRTLNAWCDVFTCVPWPCLVPERDMTHVCVCRDSCRKGGKQVIHVCAMTWWLFCLWLICVCVMTRIIRVTHRSFMCVSWLHDSFVCVPMTDSNES